MKVWRIVGVACACALSSGPVLASGVIASEGIALPLQSAPYAVSVTPERVQTGPSPWAFWLALGAQSATCATQEYAYAKFGVYGANVGTRVRNCALNVGPVIAVKVFGRWLTRSDANASIVPSIGWGVFGTVKNVRDIRTIDALLKGAK